MKYFQLLLLLLSSLSVFAQTEESIDQTDKADFSRIQAEVSIYPEKQEIEGDVLYIFNVLQPIDSIFIDAKNMQFSKVLLNGKEVEFSNSGKRLWLKQKFLPSEGNKLSLHYVVHPKQAMYFINWDAPEGVPAVKQVWTQGQGKYTSNWLPSFDDMDEKTEFDLGINFRNGYEVIANGELQQKKALNDSITHWQFDMKKPMSSYLVAVAAGKYREKELSSETGIPLKLYYKPTDSLKAEPTYRYSKKIFDFLVNEIGVAYPWQNYKQIPVQDFLYAGMENTGTTIFSNALVTDSIGFKDRNYVNVNAHELAHQWFGDLVTEESGRDHWLQEGFATYYALLAEREIFGDDYYYWKLYQSAEELKKLSDSGKGESLLNPKASSLTFYQKGAWALHMLREKVGDEAFRKAVRNYLKTYAFKNVTTENFIAEVEKASGQDLSDFMNDWLRQSAFKANAALNSLKQSEFMKKYLDLAALRENPLLQKAKLLEKALDFPVNEYLGQEVVYQLSGETSEEAIDLYKKAFETNNVFVRQAIALGMDEIPQQFRSEYESLLKDDSYLTKEAALMNLWLQFPDGRSKYLEQTKRVEGFYDKNVEMLWLTLNLVTPEYDPGQKREIFQRLSGYTAAWHPAEVRENAFGYLYQIDSFTDQNLRDLLEGTTHHDYKFRNFCRELLDKLLEDDQYHQKFLELKGSLSAELQEQLNKKLNN